MSKYDNNIFENVGKLIEYLQTLPQDSIFSCGTTSVYIASKIDDGYQLHSLLFGVSGSSLILCELNKHVTGL
ncbi:MAG: hypothetical protein LUQ65_02085 [Candidatus Helarchaeota archaeon]|nr:hypothetical protein [Candidatus Helarchaeota archaeon]